MSTAYRIKTIASGMTASGLLTEANSRLTFDKSVNLEAENGWEPFQVLETSQGLLVFLRKEFEIE